MSVQEDKFKEIADAIRTKDGSTGEIKASDFAQRILNLPSGGLPDDVYEITVEADPPEGGTVSGGGYASAGMTANLVASPNNSYKFLGWENNEEIVSESNNFVFPIIKSSHLIGKFSFFEQKLPDGYIEIEYVRAENYTAQFRPNICIYNKSIMECKVGVDSGFSSPYSACYLISNAPDNNIGAIFATAGKLGDTTYISANFGTGIVRSNPFSVGNEKQIEFFADFKEGSFQIDGNSGSIKERESVGPPFLIFGNKNAEPHTAIGSIFFKLKITTNEIENGSKDDYILGNAELIPCIDTNGVIGLYDSINKKFYSPYSGTVSAGPAV